MLTRTKNSAGVGYTGVTEQFYAYPRPRLVQQAKHTSSGRECCQCCNETVNGCAVARFSGT